MTTLAWKNMFHDKVRLAVTLTGVVFALVLIVIHGGLLLGFLETSTNIVEHSGADIWIAAQGIPHVNGGAAMPEARRYKALEVPGVARVDKFLLAFSTWKLPRGSEELVQIAGFDPDGRLGGPWNVVQGSIDSIRSEDAILIDELFRDKLGISRVGDTVEIAGYRARVCGFTHGIRSFTTAPYIFTSFKNALNYAGLTEDQTIFLLVKAKPGVDIGSLKRRLAAAVPGVDVYTNNEMVRRTQAYWVFRTGAGISTLIGAVLGLLVGLVVVAQTIYAATVDHIREFGTLKAMGAKNRYIYRVIIEQALLSAFMGYVVAITACLLIVHGNANGTTAILLPPEMVAGTLVLSAAMCVAASVISIRKVMTIDPALVFKG
jgi:putative ABC transport system permease protein